MKKLSMKNCSNLSELICDKIASEKFKPDVVIGIASGGIMPSYEIAEQLKVPLEIVIARRNIDLVNIYNKTPKILIPLVTLYQYYLFKTIEPAFIKPPNINVKSKKVLIVDDAIHTGKTMELVFKEVLRQSAAEVRSAVISQVTEKTEVDFSLLKGIYQFPWSKDSDEYQKYQSKFGLDIIKLPSK